MSDVVSVRRPFAIDIHCPPITNVSIHSVMYLSNTACAFGDTRVIPATLDARLYAEVGKNILLLLLVMIL